MFFLNLIIFFSRFHGMLFLLKDFIQRFSRHSFKDNLRAVFEEKGTKKKIVEYKEAKLLNLEEEKIAKLNLQHPIQIYSSPTPPRARPSKSPFYQTFLYLYAFYILLFQQTPLF